MKIGIEINGVLRNTIEKITQVYQKNNIDNYQNEFTGQTYKLNMSGETEEEVLPEPFKYEIKLPVTSLKLQEHFKFQTEEEFYSFLYEEFPMEIFGHSPSTEMTSFNDLNDIYYNFRKDNDFIIVSDEMGKSKPASLFFLSKFGCEIEKIFFFNNYTINSMWNEIDILLTANPSLLLEHPKNKIVIKYNTEYNKTIDSEYNISTIKELDIKLNKILLC
jgi:hypothetical protein